MNKIVCAEYIWIDGQRPTAKLRSKTKFLNIVETGNIDLETLEGIPYWSFDGSSTFSNFKYTSGKETTIESDRGLRPVRAIYDPVRGKPNILVLCEVDDFDFNTPHMSNTRAILRRVVSEYGSYVPLFGFEQEYTMYDRLGEHPLDWPHGGGRPKPQGQYYCGVGSDEVHVRILAEKHAEACLKAGLNIRGINAEVMLSQWEFQIGTLDPLRAADELWLARWLLYRIGEDLGITVRLIPKPFSAEDWNGAGNHTNFSTNRMRTKGTGLREIMKAIEKLRFYHKEHIAVYGEKNEERLTGRHETCRIDKFRYGIADRGASIRIPAVVAQNQCGYLEDRRPAANSDPYMVATALMSTICGGSFDPEKMFPYFKGYFTKIPDFVD